MVGSRPQGLRGEEEVPVGLEVYAQDSGAAVSQGRPQ